MYIYSTKTGKQHIKPKRFINDKFIRASINDIEGLYSLDIKKFATINDFEVIISVPKNPKGSLGSHCYYFSEKYGFLTSFPWWDQLDKDIKKMDLKHIPGGELTEIPYSAVEQGWEIIIFKKKDFICVLQASGPISEQFKIYYKVNIDIYFDQWKKLIDNIDSVDFSYKK